MIKNLKFLTFILVAVIMATAISLVAFTPATTGNTTIANADTSVSSVWDGTSSDTSWYNHLDNEFTLTTATQLNGLAVLTNQGISFANRTVKLGVNIDINHKSWTPIENFNGTFDGQGYTISNFVINVNRNSKGFFGTAALGLQIKNVNFDNCSVIGNFQVGIILGLNEVRTTKIENCSVINSTITSSGPAGMILGKSTEAVLISGCSVRNCTITPSSSSERVFGGILGQATNANVYPAQIDNCSVIDFDITAPLKDEYITRTGLVFAADRNTATCSGPVTVNGFFTNMYNTRGIVSSNAIYTSVLNTKYGADYIKLDGVDVMPSATLKDGVVRCTSQSSANSVVCSFSYGASNISVVKGSEAIAYTYENNLLSFALSDGYNDVTITVTVGSQILTYNIVTALSFIPEFSVFANDAPISSLSDLISSTETDYFFANSHNIKISMGTLAEGVTLTVKSGETVYTPTDGVYDLGTVDSCTTADITATYLGQSQTTSISFNGGLLPTGYDNVYYVSSGSYPWAVDTEITDYKAFKSTNQKVNSSTAQIILYVLNSNTVSLQYALSSETNYDKLQIVTEGNTNIYADGSPDAISNLVWKTFNYTYDSTGVHTITVSYSKDSSSSSRLDTAWIKNIVANNVDAGNAEKVTFFVDYDISLGLVKNVYNYDETILLPDTAYTVDKNQILDFAIFGIYSPYYFDNNLQVLSSFINMGVSGNEDRSTKTLVAYYADTATYEFKFSQPLLAPASINIDKTVNGETTVQTVANNGVVEYFKHNANDIKVYAPILNLGESCFVTVNSTRVETELVAEDGYYTYSIDDFSADQEIQFNYALANYVDGVFNFTAKVTTLTVTGPETLDFTKNVNGVETKLTINNNDTINYYYEDTNQIIVYLPRLADYNNTEKCYVTIDGVKVTSPLVEDNGYFVYTNSNVSQDVQLMFSYSVENYKDYNINVDIKVILKNGSIYDNLITEHSEPVTIVNDDAYPFVFNSALSSTDRLAFAAGNSGAGNTVSNIGFTVTGSGLFSYSVYIGSEGNFDFGLYSIGTPCTADTTTYIGGSKATASGDLDWATYYIPIETETEDTQTTIYIAYYKDSAVNKNEDTVALAQVGYYKGKRVINYSASNSDGGSISGMLGSTAFASGEEISCGQTITLTATVNENYQFYSWKDSSGNIVEKNTVLNVVINVDETYTAVIEEIGTYVALIGNTYYRSIQDAITAANSGDTVIIIDNTILAQSLTIPADVTLLIPYSADDTTGFKQGGTTTRVSWFADITPYHTVTVADGATLAVNGTLLLGGVQHYPDQSAQGHTSGAYSQIINNGNIVINGSFDNRGRVTGTGVLTTNGTLKTPFMVNNYAGGTNTENHYNNGFFPFVQFATVNIECNQVVNYGAKVSGSTSLYFWSSIYTQDIVLIDKIENKGSEGALIWMHAGSSLNISYNADKAVKQAVGNINLTDSGVTTITINGAVTAGEFYLQSYGSGDMVLSIPYTYNITVADGGTLNIAEDRQYMVMPGAVLTVNNGGTIYVNGGLYVLDGLIQADKSGKSYPSYSILNTHGFSQSGTFIVNGNVTVAATGTFAGIAQTSGNTGVLQLLSGATLTKTLALGSSGGYTDDSATITLTARIYGLYAGKILAVETGKRYHAYANTEFTLPSFTMDSAARMDPIYANINQVMTGAFGEKVNENQVGVYTDVFIGEAVADVQINISDTAYTTNASGIIKDVYVVFDVYTKEFNYYTIGKQTDTYTGTYLDNLVLTKVIKSASLATDNVYTQVIDKNGDVSTAFVLNAVLNYYGGGISENISVSGSFDNSKYVCSVTLNNNTYSDCSFTKTLKQVPAKFTLHQLDVTALADYEGDALITKATEAYSNYLALKSGRSVEEIAFLDEQMADYDDYYKIVMSISVTAATYGDANGTATTTNIDGTTDTINVVPVVSTYKYEGGNISATYTFTDTYKTKSYIVTAVCSSVSPRPVTVIVNDETSVYGDEIKPLPCTVPDGSIIGTDIAFILTKTAGTIKGTYNITGTAASNFYKVTFTYTNAKEKHSVYTITERPITVTIDNKESTYGDDIVPLTASVTTGNIVNGDNATDIFTLAKADGTDVKAGGYAITGMDINDNYKITFVDGVYTINARATTVMVANHSNVMLSKNDKIMFIATRAYGKEKLIDVTFSIKQNDVLIATATADGTIIVADGKTFGIGTYDVTANYSDFNYDVTNIAGSLTIVEDNSYYAVNFGFISNSTKIYDGTALSFTVRVKIEDTQEVLAINTDYTVSIKKNDADTVTEIKNVGAYEVKISIIGENVEYFCDFSVTEREITVTIDDKESIYGNAIKTLTASVTTGNVVDGDCEESLYSLAKAEGLTVKKNGYAITGTDLSDNYKVTFIPGVYTITERPITITIDNKESTYGDDIVPLTASVTTGNIVNGDNATDIFTLAKADGTDVKAGGYAITGIDISNNYKVNFVDGNYTITERPITVTIDNQVSTYGDPIVTLTASITSGELVIGDSKETVYSLTKADGTDVKAGGYAITGMDISTNYKVTFVDGVYTITARKITITADNKTSVFGDNLFALTAQITAGTFANDDDVTSVCELTKAAGVVVKNGGYAITGTSKNANYDITFTAGTYTITARPVKVKINDASSIYGDADANLTATLEEGSTLADGDKLDVIINIVRAAGAEVGTYDIIASPEENANYYVTIVYTRENHSVYTIDQRPITITVDTPDTVNSAATWAEISELLGYEITKGTVVNNDDLHVTFDFILYNNVTLTESNFSEQFTGGEHIIKGYYDNSNYDVTIIDGTLTVTKPIISVKNIVTTYTYTGSEIAVFDWKENLSGYLSSANENSFKATYYFGEEEISVDGVKNAGTYKMVISIVHTHAYEFESDAVLTYTLVVEKKDISDKISIVGFEDAGVYASVQAVIAMVNDYDVVINDVLTKAGEKVELPVAEPGNYTYIATIDDANYKGSASASFRIVPDVAPKISAITRALEDFDSADIDEKLAALLVIRDNIRILTADDYILIAADADYEQLIEDCKETWADYLAESEDEFEVADKAAHSNLPAAALTLISAISAAAWFSFKKFLM